MAADDTVMQDANPEPSAEPSVDVEEDDWDAVNAETTPEADGTQDAGPEESFDTEDEEDDVCKARPALAVSNARASSTYRHNHINCCAAERRLPWTLQPLARSLAKKRNVSKRRTSIKSSSLRNSELSRMLTLRQGM